MTDFDASAENLKGQLERVASFSVEDTYWGYVIRSGRGPSVGVALAQAISFFFGACLLTAALGIMVLPTLIFDGDFGVMRAGAAILFGAVAAYLLWFASRGSQAEVHVDTSVGEIREVICNRAGKPTTIGSYGFDTISGVFLEAHEDGAKASLIMRYRNTSQSIVVADGPEVLLLPLRDRLAQDLMLQPGSVQATAA